MAIKATLPAKRKNSLSWISSQRPTVILSRPFTRLINLSKGLLRKKLYTVVTSPTGMANRY